MRATITSTGPTARSVHLASTHRPGDVRIFVRECRTLSEAGFDVTYIVPHERDETVEGVRIRAVPLPQSGAERLSRTLRDVYRKAREEPSDSIFHVHDAELLPYALLLALGGRTVVYDAHEDTPRQVLAQHWIPRYLRPVVSVFFSMLEWLSGRLFDHVIAAWPGIARRYPPERTTLLRNFPQIEEFALVDLDGYSRRGNVIVYAGGISRIRGIFELLEALDRIPDNLAVRVELAGTFYPQELEREVAGRPAWDRVRFHGWLGRSELVRVMRRARIGYCVLLPTPQHVISYPNKLFEYMAAGLPVVASDFPVWREIVESADCGLLVDPRSPAEIARALQYLLQHPNEAEAFGRRGRRAFERRYNWDVEAKKLIDLYRHLSVPTSHDD